MLVLTRRMDESIAIGEDITITVLAVDGDRVKLGISAPKDVIILRKEIYEAVQAQNKIQARLVDEPEPETFEGLRKFLADESAEEDE